MWMPEPGRPGYRTTSFRPRFEIRRVTVATLLPAVEDGWRRGDHRLGQKGEGVDEVALPGAVRADEKGGVVELCILSRRLRKRLRTRDCTRGMVIG